MSAQGINETVIATMLAEAVQADAGINRDPSAVKFGPHMNAFIRAVANEITMLGATTAHLRVTLDALKNHQEQTRPIAYSIAVIDAATQQLALFDKS